MKRVVQFLVEEKKWDVGWWRKTEREVCGERVGFTECDQGLWDVLHHRCALAAEPRLQTEPRQNSATPLAFTKPGTEGLMLQRNEEVRRSLRSSFCTAQGTQDSS